MNNLQNELQFGIQTNGIKHTHLDAMPNILKLDLVWFKNTGIFDYVDKTPELSDEIDDFKKSSIKFTIYQ